MNFETEKNKENKSKNNNQDGSLIMVVVSIVVILAMVLMSGCAYQRRTQDGALAEFSFGVKILPSSASDDQVALTNKSVETMEVSFQEKLDRC